MSPLIIVLIVVSVSMSAVAQTVLKFGMSGNAMKTAMTLGGIHMAKAIMLNPYVWIGLGIYGAGTILWLGVLSKIDVSQAYPFVGLGFLLTMAFGIFLLGEPLSISRVAGTLMVLGGVLLVAYSG
jgi:drug/metabolite transporter (DMT)-like permease